MNSRLGRALGTVCSGILIGLGGQTGSWATPPIEAYGRMPSVDMMRLSPSGERYAFMAATAEGRKLAVVTTGGKILYVTNIGTVKIRDVRWAGDDHLLVSVSELVDQRFDFVNFRHEMFTVLNIQLAGNKTWSVFDKSPSVAKPVFGDFSTAQIDGHVYGYFAGLTYKKSNTGGQAPGTSGYVFDQNALDLYRVDLDTGLAKMIARGSRQHGSWEVAPKDTVIAHSEYVNDPGVWRLYKGDGRDNAPLFEKLSPLHDIGLVGLGRTTETVLVAYDDIDRDVHAEVSTSDGKREELFASLSVKEYLHDPDTDLLIGAITQDEPGARFFDARMQSRFNGARKAFPGLQVQLISFSRNLDRMIVETDGGDNSGTYWLVDVASGHADPIGYARPEIHKVEVGPTQLVKYAAADGLNIEGVLTLPPGRKPEKLPLVVMPHGGPIGVADKLGFDWWAQAYASAGYAVLQPNFRGSGTYGTEFRHAGYGQWGRKMQMDISDGMAALAAQGLIDPKRVCIVGASYGGYAALAGVTMQHGLYRCAVSVAGISDMDSFFNWQLGRWNYRYNNSPTRFWRAVSGSDKGGSELLNAISPVRFAERADAPILLIHGKDDTVVPIAQSEDMAKALRGAGKSVEFITMQGEDHWLSREETRIAMLKASVDFVKKYNPPD